MMEDEPEAAEAGGGKGSATRDEHGWRRGDHLATPSREQPGRTPAGADIIAAVRSTVNKRARSTRH
jgi:hypothetical protein